MKKCRKLFFEVENSDWDKTFIYSNEDLMTSRVPELSAKRLKNYTPDADIILVIRNQYTATPSFYVNHGAFVKPARPSYFRRDVSFDNWFEFNKIFTKYGTFASYFYDKFLDLYSDLYGKEKVHVLMFEEFVNDQESFI
mgnify:CR=1 FL=1